jgi:hypothetical protein
MLAVEGARDCRYQHREGGHAPQATRLPQREDPLHSTIALLVVAPLHQLAPEHREPQGPFGAVVGRLHPCFHHARPQGPQLPLQGAGQCPRFVLPRAVLVGPVTGCV